jgi:hypothetical protein
MVGYAAARDRTDISENRMKVKLHYTPPGGLPGPKRPSACPAPSQAGVMLVSARSKVNRHRPSQIGSTLADESLTMGRDEAPASDANGRAPTSCVGLGAGPRA